MPYKDFQISTIQQQKQGSRFHGSLVLKKSHRKNRCDFFVKLFIKVIYRAILSLKLFDYQALALIEDRALLVIINVIDFLAEGEVFKLEPFPDARDFRLNRKGISLDINTAETAYDKVDKG